jgi:hypothetical protein
MPVPPPPPNRRAFRPSETFTPVPGLDEQVQPLVHAKRFRSALKLILEVLSRDPGNEHALRLAVIVAGASITGRREAAEPLTPGQFNDSRLDPIIAVCTACRQKSWVPSAYLFPVFDVTISNPAGVQCHACGYVLCRECIHAKKSIFDIVMREVTLFRRRCPACRKRMETMVYPTGRERLELRRAGARLLHLFVFRSGPVPPDAAYLQELLPSTCAQALEDGAETYVFPAFPWPENIEEIAKFVVLRSVDAGKVPRNALSHMVTSRYVDQDQNPGLLAAIFS